jgi:hypothetical protein
MDSIAPGAGQGNRIWNRIWKAIVAGMTRSQDESREIAGLRDPAGAAPDREKWKTIPMRLPWESGSAGLTSLFSERILKNQYATNEHANR